MSEPRRQDYASDSDFIDAMAKHYGIDPRMCHQLSEVDSLKVDNVHLRTENARLKAEVERLTAENESLQSKATNIYNAMIVRCKVEEITNKANAESIISQGVMSEAMKLIEESVAIREQVERLTKAGDAMDAYLKRQDGTTNGMLPCRQAWNAAKEDKQP